MKYGKLILALIFLCAGHVTCAETASPQTVEPQTTKKSYETPKTRRLLIQQATRTCEKLVTDYCINTTCPKFCNQKGPKARKACLKECTPYKRCIIKPLPGQDSPKNKELDAQTREHIYACIAEVRDPKGKRFGHKDKPWKAVMTSYFEGITNDKKHGS